VAFGADNRCGRPSAETVKFEDFEDGAAGRVPDDDDNDDGSEDAATGDESRRSRLPAATFAFVLQSGIAGSSQDVGRGAMSGGC
jgi:hypothetical protein